MTSNISRRERVRSRVRATVASILGFGLLASGAAIGSLPAAAAAAPDTGVNVVNLEVENRTEPLGIDVEKPRFSWITSTEARDVQQSSYRVRVATTESQLASADVWDSGVVQSDESALEYGGDILQPAETYYWRVDIQTTAGEATADSTFSTGLLSESDWADSAWIGRDRVSEEAGLTFENAKWIWTPEASTSTAPAEDRAFRKTFESPSGKTATTAEIIITADDSYKLWVNERLLGQTEGADNEWQGSKRFTTNLDASTNVFAVRTTNGPGSAAGLLMTVQIGYSDGSDATFTTDETWKAIKQIPSGFEATDLDDSSWPAAAVQAPYGSGPWGNGVNLPTDPPAAAPLLRKEFSVENQIASAKIYVAAGGYANLSLNGAPINDEILSPGFTDYDDHVQYVVTDLTDQLHPGANALGMELGRGFYGMTNGNVWNWQNAPFHDEPVARAVLRIEYTDGTVHNVITDNSWTLHDGPTLVDDLYGGETYDARQVQTGFDTVGFADSDWIAASAVAGPKGELMNQSQQPIRVTESLPAESINEVEPGIYVVKFPRVLAGNVRFIAEGDAGSTIRAQYGEKLLDNGRPNFSNNGGFQNGFQTDRFILAGTGAAETWAGKFSYKGFQYIEVTGWPGNGAPSLGAFTAEALHTDAPETGSFESSNAIMNDTHRAVVDTLLNNIHSIPTDTPMFEKNGWTGDASVGAEMFLMNLDVQNMFAKWIGDINDSRDENGAPLVIAPSSDQWGQWGVNPSWHSAYILIPWWLYQYGGDSRPLQEYYDGMKAYVDLEFDRSPGGIADARLGDWVSPEASPAGGNAPEDVRVSATAYLYTMLTSMEKSATLLGKPADAADFAAQAAVVKDAFNARFYDAEGGYYRGSGDNGYRQTHNVLALSFGLTPDEAAAERVVASLAADVVAKGNKLNTGTLGTKDLLPILTEYGYEELAYTLAVQTGYPSWGYMIENGATTMWEHWSLEARSRGHYFLGTVDDWFYHDVAGINSSEETGYRDITIKPAVTDQLASAKATTQTPFGPVSVDWTKTGDRLNLKTHVPVGSTANVHLPAINSWAVTEGEDFLDDVDGVRAVAQDGENVVVTIGSGDYSFDVNPTTGVLGTVLAGIQNLQAQADQEHTDGGLADQQYSDLQLLVSAARESAKTALGTLSDGDAEAAAKKLTGTSGTVADIDAWLSTLDAPDATAEALRLTVVALREVVDATISELIGVEVSAATEQPAYKPGEAGVLAASVANGGTSTIDGVTAILTGLTDEWAGSPTGEAPLASTLPGGASASVDLGFTVPFEQVPGEVAAAVTFSYFFNGATVRITTPTTVGVDSPISLTSVVVDPATVAPGQSTVVTATVHNAGTQPAAGHLEVAVPAGWVTPLATGDVLVPAGADQAISVPVFVPIGAVQAESSVALSASFVYDGVVFASGTANLGVVLAPVPDPLTGYDHVDLGNTADEQAHNLVASESSGTSTEAGLTRRYAGHLNDFAYFEFDTAVVPGQPFMIRATETYDRPQTKKYRVYVDGTLVAERVFSHTAGVGTETYEVLVDAALATENPVRIKFENLDDHTFYDPSIADVWTLPAAADTTAPQVTAIVDPSVPNRATGWYTEAPVSVSLAARDDRDGNVAIRYTLGDGAPQDYSEPVNFADDGEHTISYLATDAAGNASDTRSLAMRIDTVAPETQATLGEEFDGDTAKTSGTVTFDATDETSGVASTSHRVNGGVWAEGDSVTVSEAGDFTVEFFSTDVAGNVEATDTLSGTIVFPDVIAPTTTVEVSDGGTNGWYLEGAAATISAEDSGSGIRSIEYRIGDDAWTAYSEPVELPEGETTLQYRATDNEGNVSAVAAIQVKVDSTMPTSWGWLTQEGRLTVVGTDTGSSIHRIEYSLDGDIWVEGLSQLIAGDSSPATVQYRPVDRAGNTGEVVTLTRSGAPTSVPVVPGSHVLVESSGFVAGQTVQVEVHPGAVTLATAIADARGVVSVFAAVPDDLPSGEHTLVLAVDDAGSGNGGGSGNGDNPSDPGNGSGDGDNPSDPGNGTVTIPADVIAFTGAAPLPLVALGLSLLLAGIWVVARKRRIRASMT